MKKIKLILLALTIFSAKFYAQVPSYVPTTGLVGWWPFNGNANDLSGNGNNGTVNGATLTTDRFGLVNSAYSFNGQSILIPLNQQIVSMPSRTISIWFKSSQSQTGGRLFEATNYSWGIGCYNSTTFDCWYQKSNQAYNFIGESFQTNNTWHNLVFMCDSLNQQKKVYLNGSLINSGIPVANPGNPNAWINHFLKIGLGNANEAFIGLIDDIGIWNRALTQNEITALFSTTYTNTPPPTFSIQANGCPNVSYQPTNFTPNAGSSYQWTITPSAGSQNSTGLNTVNPTFIFNSGGTYSITVQETNNGNTLTSAPASISILNLANITPSVNGTFMQVINGVNTFPICSGPSTTSALVYNENWGNPPNTTYSYTINNGAQTPITTSATVPITYGNNTFTLTATSGVCALTNTINIYSGANPYVALGANSTISLCPGSTVNFVIDPTQSAGVNNSPGTTYSLIFSDNPTAPVNMSNLVNDTIIPHQYNVTSCGVSNVGTTFPNNTYFAVVTAQNACGTTQSFNNPITVHNLPTANFTVSDSTICAGQTITVTNTGNAGSIVGSNSPYNCATQGKFYWTITGGTLGTNFTIPAGQQLGSFSPAWGNLTSNGSSTLNVTFLTPGTYTITQNYYNSCGTKTKVRSIQVGGIIAGANQSVCLGNSVTLTASGGSNYAWSGGIQNGVPFTPTSTQTYTVTGTATGGCPNTSSTTVTVNPVPSANAGNDFTITCSLNPTGSTIGMASAVGNSYSWTPTAGLSSASVANPTANPSSSTTYTLSVTNANGCTANDQVVVTVNNTPPTISTPPISSQSICVGGAASTLNVVVSGGTGVPTYQWFTVNGSTSTPIPGATNSSYTPPIFNTAGTFIFTVSVSQSINGCNSTSPNAQVIVVPDPILTAPLSANYCQNGVASPLNVTVSGGINTSYSYQWYINTNNSNVGGTIIAGANSPTYTPPTSMIGTYFYYCIVTNNPTSTGCSTSSPIAQIVIVSSPAFISQPQSNQSTCLGGILNALNVAYTGGTGTATFQWYSNTTNLNSGGTAIPGATSATYLPQSNSAGTVYYYCVISFFSMGSCQSITSNVSTVTVLSTTTVNPVFDQTLCAGTQTSPIIFTGTAGATYTWTNSNTSIGLASGGTGNISSFIAQNNSSTSITATIAVTPSVTIGNQTCVGTPEIFTITVHPIPVLVSNNDITVCCQANPTLMLSANLPSSFNWTASSSSPLMTGFPSGINNSNFISFTPINNSNVTGTIIISIEPTSLQGCVGQVETININVLPCNVSINQISNTNLCNDAVFNGIIFTGTATQVQWINSNPNNGLQFSGMGNIPSIPIVNNGLNAILSQITVYPEYTWNSMSCIGTSMTFEFNIYPTPAVNAGTDQIICSGNPITLNGSGANSYVWNNGILDGVAFNPTTSDVFVVTGTDVNGCVNSDSVNVTVLEPSNSSQSITGCDSYSLNGQTYTSSGIYSQIIPNAAGCDSTITLDLTLNYSPSTPIVTIQNEVNLSTSNNTGVTYQWIQCSDLTAIAGQTNPSFNPAVNGLYAVVATNSCGSDTSDCAEVSTIGLNDLIGNKIKLYPNPNDGQFYLEVHEQFINQHFEIYDLNGRLVFTQELNATLNLIQTDKLSRGSYILHFPSEKPLYFIIL